jgi:hypothetical protein
MLLLCLMLLLLLLLLPVYTESRRAADGKEVGATGSYIFTAGVGIASVLYVI